MIDDVAVLRRCAVERSQDVFAELVRRNLAGVYPAVLRRVGEDFSDTTLMAEQAETLKMVFSGTKKARGKPRCSMGTPSRAG